MDGYRTARGETRTGPSPLRSLPAVVRVESLLLARDRAGLAVLFLMPAVLVLVITLVQDPALRQFHGGGTRVLLVNADEGDVGKLIAAGMDGAGSFTLVPRLPGEALTEESLARAVAAGRFQAGVVIPAGTSAAFGARLSALMESVGGLHRPAAAPEGAQVRIYLDPALPSSVREALVNSVRYLTSEAEKQAFLRAFAPELSGGAPAGGTGGEFALIRPVFREQTGRGTLIPNSVQQNVPAWTLFAMFFVVIPLSGTIIKEKREMIFVRLRALPGSYPAVIAGRLVAYVGVCLVQFLLILGIGVLLLPRLGLPALQIGHWLPLAAVSLAAALAATAYGVLVGTVASTPEQASTFGAVSVVIAAAIGGIMVPVFAMPRLLQHVASLSPLCWGLDGFLKVFVRGATLGGVLRETGLLAGFAAVNLAGAGIWYRLRLSR